MLFVIDDIVALGFRLEQRLPASVFHGRVDVSYLIDYPAFFISSSAGRNFENQCLSAAAQIIEANSPFTSVGVHEPHDENDQCEHDEGVGSNDLHGT